MKSGARTRLGGFVRVFGWPILLALFGAIGLISALLGDDVWDVLSWAGLAAPVLVLAWHVLRPVR